MQYVWIDEFKKWFKELREVYEQVRMIRGELQKEKDILKPKKEDQINLLEWRLKMEKILMEHNDKDESLKEWDIMGSDWESKFDEYAEDIKKE